MCFSSLVLFMLAIAWPVERFWRLMVRFQAAGSTPTKLNHQRFALVLGWLLCFEELVKITRPSDASDHPAGFASIAEEVPRNR